MRRNSTTTALIRKSAVRSATRCQVIQPTSSQLAMLVLVKEIASQVKTSPTSSLCSMPPPLSGEALASRHVFDDFAAAPFGFIGDETSLPRAPLPGELASVSETERLDKGRLSSERNNAGAALYNLSVIFASLDATSPSRGGFGRRCGPNLSVTPAACHLP